MNNLPWIVGWFCSRVSTRRSALRAAEREQLVSALRLLATAVHSGHARASELRAAREVEWQLKQRLQPPGEDAGGERLRSAVRARPQGALRIVEVLAIENLGEVSTICNALQRAVVARRKGADRA